MDIIIHTIKIVAIKGYIGIPLILFYYNLQV